MKKSWVKIRTLRREVYDNSVVYPNITYNWETVLNCSPRDIYKPGNPDRWNRETKTAQALTDAHENSLNISTKM